MTPQFRAWNRISIFIGFFALLAVALALTELGRRWNGRPAGRLASGAVLAAILVAGAFDQTSTANVPRYDSLESQYRSDGQFVSEIEGLLPRGADVLQLPYVPFPEAGLSGELGDYDLGRAYLHSHDLNWSFGATKGRDEDWLAPLAEEPVEDIVAAAVAAGFAGLYVDRFGYADRAAAVEARVSALLGERAPLVSQNERLSFFDLRDYREAETS